MTSDRIKELSATADILRENDPVLWAVIRGRSHRGKIGILLGKTPGQLDKMVTNELRLGAIRIPANRPHLIYLNKLHPNYALHMELKQFLKLVELRWLNDWPEMAKTTLLSAPTISEWEIAHPEAKKTKRDRFNDTLTTKQAESLVSLQPWLPPSESTWGPNFTPMQVAAAQGYTQAGWTKKTLESLLGKGFITLVRARPTAYRLTTLGVETITKALEAGVKPKKREVLSTEGMEDL